MVIKMINEKSKEIKNKDSDIPVIPRGYSEIEREVFKMLMENTGVNPFDSGFLFGRHWERNREVKDFKKLPSVYVDVDDNYINFEIDVFHFLVRILEINDISKTLDRRLKEYIDSHDESYFKCMDDFMDILKSEGWNKVIVFNTYDFDYSILSQGLQGIIFSDKDEKSFYVMLQVHNGADIRGGYTFPRVFKLVSVDYFFIWQSEINAYCDCDVLYSDDGGYSWESNSGVLKTDDYSLPSQWENKDGKVVCSRCGKRVKFYVDF